MRDRVFTFVAVVIVLGLIWGLNKYLRPGEKPIIRLVPDAPKVETAKSEGAEDMTAVIETSMGTFSFKFYPEDAPGTVDNFIKLAKQGFYDGTIFHRVIGGFMMQGGDPTGTGTGGPGYTIKAEFNKQKHVAGTVAMARTADPDSAGSQFYVCLGTQPHLDGKYTVFGQVTEGMDVVRSIGSVPTGRNDRPIEDIVMKKVTILDEASAEE